VGVVTRQTLDQQVELTAKFTFQLADQQIVLYKVFYVTVKGDPNADNPPQHILRRKRLVQHEKPLVEQRAKRLLHAVGAGDGVERHALQIRQCERRDRRQGGGGVRFHRRRFLPEVAAAVVAHIAAPAARKRKRERQRAQSAERRRFTAHPP